MPKEVTLPSPNLRSGKVPYSMRLSINRWFILSLYLSEGTDWRLLDVISKVSLYHTLSITFK